MSKIRASAQGEMCTIRLPGICSRDRTTTVLAHYRLPETCGTGIKPPDYLGAYACSACHDAADGRSQNGLSREELDLAHAEGVMRTLVLLEKKGLVQTDE